MSEADDSGKGLFYFWSQRALYLGPGLVASLHAHHAVQVFIGLSDPIPLRVGPSARWEQYEGALIPSDQSHESEPAVPLIATFWLEPESRDAKQLARLQTGHPIARLESSAIRELAPRLRDCWQRRCGSRQTAALMDEVLDLLAPRRRDPPAPTDERVERAREILGSALGAQMTLADVAEQVGLSQSRLTHLFRDQLGLLPTRYRLWTRLRHALEALAKHSSVTDAAYAAGFSDGPHLSRTFRGMLGFSPAAALGISRFVQDDPPKA